MSGLIARLKLPEPLYSPHGNSLNPEYFNTLVFIFNVVIAVLAFAQIVSVVYFNYFNGTKIKYAFGIPLNVRSMGISYLFRISAVTIQVVLFALLAFLSYLISTWSSFAVLLTVMLPLHVIEPTRSIVQSYTLLLFWLAHAIVSVVFLIQDLVSPIKMINVNDSELVLALQIVSCINIIFIFILETWLWFPSVELVDYFELNEWEIDSVPNFFSSLTFGWIQPTIKKIKDTEDVSLEDLPPVPYEFRADVNAELVSSIWHEDLAKGKTPSLALILIKAYSGTLLTTTAFSFFYYGLSFYQPFILKKLISYFSQRAFTEDDSADPPIIIGFYYAGFMFLVSIIKVIFSNQSQKSSGFATYYMGSALTALLYKKALFLSPNSRKKKTNGDIINNISTDVGLITGFLTNLHDFIAAPISMVLVLLCLYKVIGKATWGAVVAALVSIPGALVISLGFTGTFKRYSKYKDERVSLITEILSTVKSIKFYSWEKPMLAKLGEVRNDKELSQLRTIGVLSAFAMFIFSCIPFFISVAAFYCYSKMYDIPLTPEIVFPALSLFDLLTGPIFLLPHGIVAGVQCKVSLNRLSEFLNLEEQKDQIKRYKEPINGDIAVRLQNIKVFWSKKEDDESAEEEEEAAEETLAPTDRVALDFESFVARKGELNCIVGRVGSGKSTFIRLLLGELETFEENDKPSNIEIAGSVAYVPQSPWILNGTVKENILFGCKFDREFYEKTIDACQLVPDFESLPDGDHTTVGEKGVSLSGGQKARVALARAVYSRARVIILDDILSAVDSHVGEKITEKVLSKNGLLSGRTIVLATNSVPVLHRADKIVLLKGGRITEEGTFSAVHARKSELYELIKEFGRKDQAEVKTEPAQPEVQPETPDGTSEEESVIDINAENVPLRRTVSAGVASFVSFTHAEAESIKSGVVRRTGQMEEERSRGRVSLSTILEFLRACNFGFIAFYILFIFGVSISNLLEKVVLTVWSEKNAEYNYTYHAAYYLGIYILCGVLGGLCLFIGSYIIWNFSIIPGAKTFHERLAQSVLRSPMSFFETTPIGRILNRFTDDIGKIDMEIPWNLIGLTSTMISAIVTLAVITYNLPVMALIIVFLLVFYNQLRVFYIPASRENRRLRSVTTSPVYAHIEESLNGMDTIKAFNQVSRFQFKNETNLNLLTRTRLTVNFCDKWLNVRLGGLSASITFLTALFSVFSLLTSDPISPALLGFLMSYALSISLTLSSIISLLTNIENDSVTIERLVEYFNLPSEAPLVIDETRPPASWPDKGAIKFVDYTTKYRENLDPVLKNINFDVKSQEKIGIVGRTGAGKSTLTLALFRIIEATGGHIEIDGIDTSKLGLFDLRHHLSIIPQDSQTIVGTARENLDPFENYTDEQLWKALELSHLKDHIEQMKTEYSKEEYENAKANGIELVEGTRLQAKINSGGSNLSAGQKQLLCIARALLVPSKVLLLDEATASVDVQTDKLIQETIRKEFKDRTILTIAHRLETILDSDRVLVLDKGEVKEYDTPEKLLADSTTIFYSLCKQAGHV